MKRGVVVVALGVVASLALGACSDSKAPAGRSGSGASGPVSSGSEQALARSMARTLADGIQQGAAGRVSTAQADCLVTEITNRIRVDTLTSIASTAPDPKTLPTDVRTSFGAAFDKCLPNDIAGQLRQKFGL
ncbi:MAG TPA: hypothetical protein VGZ52_03600 [Acidimicrobiales bacterium]|jgi:hypothetical protein|nr:hypothetical protein [Acidimicrobiales bacterium]